MTPEQYKEIRKRLGMTQAALATALGVTSKTIRRRESGETEINKEAELAIKTLDALKK